MTKLTVGQKLWGIHRYDSRHPWQEAEVTVAKIGRRWATLSSANGFFRGERIDMNDDRLPLDGKDHTSLGRCFLSREHRIQDEAAEMAWRGLFYAITNRRWDHPAAVTAERIQEARRLLGLEE